MTATSEPGGKTSSDTLPSDELARELVGDPTGAAHEDDEPLEPLPAEFSAARVLRGLLLLAGLITIVGLAIALLPGFDSVRDRFDTASLPWLLVAIGLQICSCASYVIAMRTVFCPELSWRRSTAIGMSELAANSLLSIGGAGGLALGAWLLRRHRIPVERIARRTVAFFLLTSAANVIAVVIAGVGLSTGLLHGAPSIALGIVPAVGGSLMIIVVLSIRPIARWFATRTRRERVEITLNTIAAGVAEAVELLREHDPRVILGAAGYMLFNVAVLGVCFTAFGDAVPPIGVLMMAYLIGQLGGLLPMPGGIGGVDGGLIGTLILYGVATTPAAVAVLAYRVIVLWVPPLIGLPMFFWLLRRLRLDAAARALQRQPKQALSTASPCA